MACPYLVPFEGGVELRVLVQPRASRTRIVGEHDGMLKIQLAAPPVEGAANRALVEFLADRLDVPRARVELVAGDAARRKRIRLHGLDATRVEAVMNGPA